MMTATLQADPCNQNAHKPVRQAKRAYCLPCKERRVKCDMCWPACTRCLKKTRSCSWDARLLPSSANDVGYSRALIVQSTTNQCEDGRQKARSIQAKRSVSTTDSCSEKNDYTMAVQEITSLGPDTPPSKIDRNKTCTDKGDYFSLSPPTTSSSSTSSSSDSLVSCSSARPFASYLRMEIPTSLSCDRETLYTNAFFNGWLKQHLADPEAWTTAFLQHKSTPLLTSAIHLLGNLQIDPRGSALRYQKCISLLQKKLRSLGEESGKIDACVTISLLAGYELCLGTAEAFGHHLHAIAALIRSEVGNARLLTFSSRLFRLVTYSCLDSEIVYNFLVKGAPRIAWDEWQQSSDPCSYVWILTDTVVLPLEVNSSDEDIEYRRICEAGHVINSITSGQVDKRNYAMIYAIGIEVVRRYTSPETVPWITELQKCMSSDALRMLWSRKIPVLSPYSHLYFYPSKCPQESMFHTTYGMCFRTLELHLISRNATIELSPELDEKCNIVAGMVSTLGAVNQSDWWCLLATWTLVKLYRRLLAPSDARLLYNHALLEILLQVTSIENWKLLESEHFNDR